MVIRGTQAKLLATFCVLFLSARVLAQAQPAGEDSYEPIRQTIRNLTKRWDDALVKKDLAALNEILSDDYSPSGFSKEEWVTEISDPRIIYTSYKREIFRITVYGDTALSFANNTVSGKYGETQFTTWFDSMDVWIRKDTAWRCIATMANRIKNADDNKEKMVRVGPDVKYSFVVYFKKKVTEQQIESFLAQNIHRPFEDGDRRSFQAGICQYLRLLPLLGHDAFAIQTCEGTAPYERENIKKRFQNSPIVQKVMENVAPADVKKIN